MYLYGGQCESICPPKTYADINADGRAVCLPCHYTCLTCAGDSDGHCTSCHDEAILVPSSAKVSTALNRNKSSDNKVYSSLRKDIVIGWNTHDDIDIENLPLSNENYHLSYGKRESEFYYVKKNQVVEKKAVTKKILKPFNDATTVLFYCYPGSMMNQLKSSTSWYYRMSVLFAFNLFVLSVILMYLLWKKFCSNSVKNQLEKGGGGGGGVGLKYGYLKMNNSDIVKMPNGENIIYLSSSSDEEELLVNKGKAKLNNPNEI